MPTAELDLEAQTDSEQPTALTVISGGPQEVDAHLTGSAREIAELRLQLDERDRALLRAAISVSELQFELEASKEAVADLRAQAAQPPHRPEDPAPAEPDDHAHIIKLDGRGENRPHPEPDAEIERLRKEWMKSQRALERSQAERKAETAKLRSQLHEAQHQQLLENRARRMESAHSSARIANLQRDMQAAVARAAEAELGSAKGGQTNVRLAAASAASAAILAALITWASLPGPTQGTVRRAETAHAAVQTAPPQEARAVPPLRTGTSTLPAAIVETGRAVVVSPLSQESRSGFQAALSRLNRVLTAFPGKKPEQVLREVHQAYAKTDPTICSFEWNHGQPAVLYSGEGNRLTLGATLSRCAEALEHQIRQ